MYYCNHKSEWFFDELYHYFNQSPMEVNVIKNESIKIKHWSLM